jgi:2-oxoglutarate dehydrogenase complex dehydrogenase (E1) component-like enzyme
VLLCSGKIYYALLAGRRERSAGATALIRIEQLYPFPRKELETLLAAYPNAEQAYWVQEEPANMGALRFIEPLLRPLLDGRKLSCIARDAAASPATGSYKVHQAEEAELVQRAFARA